jgi:parallel beta-helix repeat protein
VKLEDCSGVALVNNTIMGNAGSGVDCVNARGILVTSNVITGNAFGVSVKPYDGGSFYREFSPLDARDAGASSISVTGNIVEKNEHDWYVHEGCTVIELTG